MSCRLRARRRGWDFLNGLTGTGDGDLNRKAHGLWDAWVLLEPLLILGA